VLEQVKIIQLQNVGFSHHIIPLTPEPDDPKPEHFDQLTQLWHNGVTFNLPFSVAVGKAVCYLALHGYYVFSLLLNFRNS